jgi:methionyl-tRNA formyltransferase
VNLVAAASDPRALACLERFNHSPHTLLALLTAPDRPQGRGKRSRSSALTLWAKERGIPVLQPEDVNAPEVLAALKRLTPDALPVIAYGQRLGPGLLALPRHGCLNLHPSLLPRHRGAAPIPWAILSGDAGTGVSIFRMVSRMDAGPLLAARAEPIRPDDTAGTLGERLFALGPDLFDEAIEKLAHGGTGEPQDETQATRAPLLRKEDGRVDWRREALALARQVRALQPWPGAYGLLQSSPGDSPLRLVFWRARVVPGRGAAGTLLAAPGDDLVVACGQDALAIEEVQPEGRRRMETPAFLRGTRIPPGAAFLPAPPA